MTCDAFACGVQGVLTGIVGRTQGLQACTSFTRNLAFGAKRQVALLEFGPQEKWLSFKTP